jgi:hypothetical protein
MPQYHISAAAILLSLNAVASTKNHNVAGACGRRLSLQNTETIEYKTLVGLDIHRLEN